MKKWVVAIGLFVVIFLIFTAAVIIFAFTKTKPTAEKINQKLTDKFQKIVRIPINIVIAKYTFDSTLYIWEMTTPQNEAVPVSFAYNPDFLRTEGKTQATLEMVQGGDPSIFDKVSAAVIADRKTGFVVKNLKEAESAMENIDLISRENCRERVEKNFTVERMVDNYEKVYQKILKAKEKHE